MNQSVFESFRQYKPGYSESHRPDIWRGRAPCLGRCLCGSPAYSSCRRCPCSKLTSPETGSKPGSKEQGSGSEQQQTGLLKGRRTISQVQTVKPLCQMCFLRWKPDLPPWAARHDHRTAFHLFCCKKWPRQQSLLFYWRLAAREHSLWSSRCCREALSAAETCKYCQNAVLRRISGFWPCSFWSLSPETRTSHQKRHS